MFQGSYVALVTPMQEDGALDKRALHDLIEWHITEKTDGFVIYGTTGEAATLSDTEKHDLITTVVKQVGKRIPVIAGTGTNSSQTTLELTLDAQKSGADGCLLVTPYYNKPTQNGLYEHYKFVAENSDIPLILYNVPGRTSVDMLPETIARISHLKNVVGVKEATGNLDRVSEILNLSKPNFEVYSGDDATACDLMLMGGHGVISVTANVAPRKMHEMYEAVHAKNKTLADKINQELMPLHKKLFLESNPIPTKWALHEMGLISSGIRLPLLPLDVKYHEELRQVLQHMGLVQTVKEI